MMFSDPFGWFPNPFFVNAFPVLIAVVFLGDFLIPRITTSKNQDSAKNADQNSFTIISLATLVSVAVGIAVRLTNLGTWRGVFQWAGLVVIVLGAILRAWALLNLGRFFSRTVQIKPDHKIITSGPYRWIRHPAYTGMILIYTGFIMAIGSWLGALLTFLIITASLYYRIRIEEKALIASLGDEYLKYKKQTWFLFPGW